METKLSPQQRAKLQKVGVISLLVSIFTIAMYFNFRPDESTKEESQKGINTVVPEATTPEINDNRLQRTPRERAEQRVREEMSDVMQSQIRAIENDTPHTSITQANTAYREINSTVGSFYDRPTIDREKIEMQAQIEELKSQIETQQQLPDNSIDDQIALMERTYELAAKYTGAESMESEEVGGKAKICPVSRAREKIVSSLTPMSQSGFTTPLSNDVMCDKNTIAACIESDQTIIDEGAVRIRLLEPMMVGRYELPRGITITGQGEISGERLNIAISQIEHRGRITPVELSVIDSDGVMGIFVPNSMEVSAMKEIAANMGSSLGTTINLTEQSAGDQTLAELGKGAIQGVSKYATKKIQEVKVHLKAGYRVMLYQEE